MYWDSCVVALALNCDPLGRFHRQRSLRRRLGMKEIGAKDGQTEVEKECSSEEERAVDENGSEYEAEGENEWEESRQKWDLSSD